MQGSEGGSSRTCAADLVRQGASGSQILSNAQPAASESPGMSEPDRRKRLEINWRPARAETNGDTVFLDKVGDLSAELADLQSASAGSFATLGQGSHGKGASGAALLTAWEVAEHLLNDTASLIALGYALRDFIRRVTERRGKPPGLINAEALTALAAAAAADELDGAYHVKTVPLNVDEGVGTDERDVWAVVFDDPDRGRIFLVLMSPSGLGLGALPVPVEWYFDEGELRTRTPEAIAAWWQEQSRD